jgi:DNA-binding response OmpR family regulator/signal transduction histidine kinase
MRRSEELILVVDDSQDTLSILVDGYLRGYQTKAARNADQAWQIIRTHHPDLILLDHHLPDIKGLDLFQQIRVEGITTPVIMMTGYGSEKLAVRALQLEVQDYLIKPIKRDQILAAVTRALLPGRLDRKLKQRVQELTELETVGQHIAEGGDLDVLLNHIVESGVAVTQASSGCLWLLDRKNNELYLQAEKNLGKIRENFLRFKVQDDLLGQVIQSRRPVRRGKTGDLTLNVIPDYQAYSVLQVPLVTGDQVIGVLSVQNSIKRLAFSQNDQERLLALANYAVIAVRNAEKVEALLQAQDRLAVSDTLARMGMFGSIWAHSVAQEVMAIRNYLAVLEHYLPDGKPRELIAKVDEVAVAIQNIPIPEELPADATFVTPLLIDRTLKHQVESYADARANVALELHLHCPGVEVKIDQRWLEIVIELLLRNSFRAMPNGGTLSIATTIREKRVDIFLIDTGHGIPEEHLPYFLTRRVPKKDDNSGTGMGVLLARDIIKRFGGDLKLERSEPGQGTTLRISLEIAESIEEQYQ